MDGGRATSVARQVMKRENERVVVVGKRLKNIHKSYDLDPSVPACRQKVL
jgi:hypothetical protein